MRLQPSALLLLQASQVLRRVQDDGAAWLRSAPGPG